MNEKTRALYELQAEICHSLSHPIRLHIIDLLGEGEKTSTDLLEILDIPKANLSQHLSVLKDVGILKTRKEGQFQYISLAVPKIKDACSLVRGILSDRLEEQGNILSELKKKLKKGAK